jgi:hypothetical protein
MEEYNAGYRDGWNNAKPSDWDATSREYKQGWIAGRFAKINEHATIT